MQEDQGPVHAPEFPSDVTWLQGGPLTAAELRGRPFVVDFWDYTCINCIRTLPYLKEWHHRYHSSGLAIIGVHAPEFSFAREASNVLRAVREHGIEYPVVLDNDYAIWQAYANRYWPAKHLVDGNGYIRGYHHGEGAYRETEEALQALLREASPDILLPGVMEPVREEDNPGAVCYRVTPELYAGYARGNYGNADIRPDTTVSYSDPGKHTDGMMYLDGEWLLTAEYLARPVGAKGESRLTVPYLAKDVNLVIHPPAYGGPGTIAVSQDGEPLSARNAAVDVIAGDTTSIVTIDTPRMYRLVSNPDLDRHELTLRTTSDGITMYAFTFTSCVIPA